ncbi:MAG: hypothetical protein AAF806_05850 [Bacteroidota bacterium]
MNKVKILVLLFICSLVWNCEPESKGTTTTDEAVIPTNLPAPIEDQDLGEVKQGLEVGAIKEACQLVTEEWLKRYIPGFQIQIREESEIKRLSRTSPDGNASACQCTAGGEKIAFVLGYKKSAGNLQYINTLLTEGLKKEDDFNIPPYQEVFNLGQKAAFSKYNGNLAWVTEGGLYLYMYIYPQSTETMKDHFNILYSVAPQISQMVKQYGGK